MKHVLMELMDCTYYLNTKKSSVRFDFWCNDVLLCKMWFSCFGLHDMDWNTMHKNAQGSEERKTICFQQKYQQLNFSLIYSTRESFFSSRERVSNPNFRTKLILGRVLLPVSYSASPIHIGSMNCLYVYINTYLMSCWHFLD